MKIDIFPHILPTKYMEAVNRISGDRYYNKQVNEAIPTIYDLDIRFRVLDQYGDMVPGLDSGRPAH